MALVSSAWSGVQFFVCVDVLVTFDSVNLSNLEVRPGQPERHIALVDGKALPVTSYPLASFFLKALKAAGCSVIVVSPWKPEKTRYILRLFGWDAFDDVRAIYMEPGDEKLGLSSVECAIFDYNRSVIVATSRAVWHAVLWSQVVEVRHENVSPYSSLALVRATSSCLRIVECHLRFPQVAISSCIALCRANLFSQCRFFLTSDVAEQSSVAMTINEHGGYLVKSCKDATHCVVSSRIGDLACALQKTGPNCSYRDNTSSTSYSSSCFSASTISSSGVDEVGTESERSSSSSSGLENYKDIFVDGSNYNGDADAGTNKVANLSSQLVTEGEFVVSSASACCIGAQSLPAAFTTQNSLPVTARTSSGCGCDGGAEGKECDEVGSAAVMTEGTMANTVTTEWLQDCVDALLVYPPKVAHSFEDTSKWNISTLFLSALIPSPEADPVPLSRLNNLAECNGFFPLRLPEVEKKADLAALLQKQWGSVLRVEIKEEEILLKRHSFLGGNGGSEMERHLLFVASQCSDAWFTALRARLLRSRTEAGTQTAAVVTASFGTNTEIAPSYMDGVSADQLLQGRSLLTRAVGPEDWAKRVDAANSAAYRTLRSTDQMASLEPTSIKVVVKEPTPRQSFVLHVGETSATVDEKKTISLAHKEGEGDGNGGDKSTVGGDCGIGENKEETVMEPLAAGEIPTPVIEQGEFLTCFIPTETLGEERETLDKDVLLGLPPFRNYPMKLTVDKWGIYCRFATVFDAKCFYQEGYAEVRNRFLPITPVYRDKNLPVSTALKRQHSRSTVVKKLTSSSHKRSRKELPLTDLGMKSHRKSSETKGVEDDASTSGLSKSDIALLGEIGATYDFAVQQVDVVEHYALNELSDPVYRKQQQRLLRLVSKLKKHKG